MMGQVELYLDKMKGFEKRGEGEAAIALGKNMVLVVKCVDTTLNHQKIKHYSD